MNNINGLRCSLLFILVSLFSACAIQYHGKGTLSWQEEFNQKYSFDSTKWTKIPRGGSDWNRHMSNIDSCYAMRNGKLVLRGLKNTDLAKDTSRYLTGGVYTKDKVVFGYGRLEISAKLNGAKGAWPAFWMLAENSKWPDGGEIDIMERLNHDSIIYQTIHSYYTLSLKIKNNPKSSTTAKIAPDRFNTYAVEKYPDSLVFYVNKQKTFTYPRISTTAIGQFPFANTKHYVLLDMQLGGNWVGKIADADLPTEMEIDWVRFYTFKK